MEYLITFLLVLLTFGAYVFSRYLCRCFHNPLLNVVVVSSAIVITVMLAFHVPYEMYQPGKDLITLWLGPTMVSLAVPLYTHRSVLKKYRGPIMVGVCLASTVTAVTAMSIARLAGFSQEIVVSIGTKSVTAPIAAEIAQVNGGDPGLAIAFVIVAGTLGAMVGPALLTLLKITNPVIRGLALGTVSHGQGTAIALSEGEQQGLMAGIGMALAAIVTSTVIPIAAPLVLNS